MSDRWRDTYDEWKTREPDADARVCDLCGGWMRFDHAHALDHGPSWYCEACDEALANLGDDEDRPL
jgi:hypothetical protein